MMFDLIGTDILITSSVKIDRHRMNAVTVKRPTRTIGSSKMAGDQALGGRAGGSMKTDVGCDARRESYRCDTQEIANDQAWTSGARTKIEVVQARASGHPLAQSGLTGCFSGQHGISSAICMPGMPLETERWPIARAELRYR